MDPLPVDDGSLACLLRATWIQQALADPCALHTTLYAASAHLDAFRGAKNSNMTLYHHTLALRLLQERINDPDAVFSESLMACVAPLVFFSVRLFLENPVCKQVLTISGPFWRQRIIHHPQNGINENDQSKRRS
jgi:hypothetical protein